MSANLLYSCPDALYDTFERKPGQNWTTHYCPGCGHGVVQKCVAEAIDDLGVQDRTIFVSPVGCAVFAYYYFDVGNVQVAHGRCPAVATAMKRAHPHAVVLGYQGDGDLAAIGGNEILHAANRGENLTIFFVNNAIYGMTGGQMAPTTLVGMQTTTTPAGRSARTEGFPVRVCELLATLDAPYYLERVAIGDAKHNRKARAAIHTAIRNQVEERGFSLVEILTPCPTGWKLDPVEAARFSIEEMTKTFPLGVFRDGHELDLGHPRRRAEVAPEEIAARMGLAGEAESPPLPDHGRPIDECRIKIAGFGGQGVILLGTLLAYAGVLSRRQVSWIPSYGPEMRGGTANCSVTLADEEIGTPLIEHPSILVAMNGPSLERFGGDVVPGGTIVVNGSMVERPVTREDVTTIVVPANEIAERLGEPRAANMVLLGALLARGGPVSCEAVLAALPQAVPGADARMLDLNRRALQAGRHAAQDGV